MRNKMNYNNPAAVAAAAKGDLENFMVAAMPGGIEQQEAMGQSAFVGTKGSLPRVGLMDSRPGLEQMGFVIGEPIDDLFVSVTMPPGWSKKATDHSMWSNVVDEKGRERIVCFYKAAFYDRSAHMNLIARYRLHADYPNEPKDCTAHMKVTDWDGTVLFDPGFILRPNAFSDPGRDACLKWLEANYPDWKNPAAYWD